MITNNANGKVYIGQSVCVNKRQVYHFACLKRGVHQNKHLQAAYNKYGQQCFDFKVLIKTAPANLNIMERAWIKHYRCCHKKYGYNKDNGGTSKKVVSDVTKKILSDKNKGKIISEEVRKKISASLRGRVRSEAHRSKLSNSLKGRRPSDDCINASVASRKGRKLTDEQRKAKSVAWHNSKASIAHLRCLAGKNTLTHDELMTRAMMPKPNRKENDMAYQNWWKARKRLGLPTKNI